MSNMTYGIVRHAFWTGATGRQLRGDTAAQIVALYLMTSPHGNSLGVYRCPVDYVKLETGCPFEVATKALRRLSEAGFCTFDEETETVWVHEMARFQIGAVLKPGDKRQKHIQRIFDGIENRLIQQAFFEKYGSAYQLKPPPHPPEISSPNEGASEILARPIEAKVNVKVNVNSAPNGAGAAAPPDPEKELFERGKQVLGRNAGGQIAKLKAAKGGSIALARAAIEQASTKQDPGEYIAAVIRGGAGRPASAERPTGGFAAILIDGHLEQANEPLAITHIDAEGPDLSREGYPAIAGSG